jgi:uncharacterized protein DUF11
MQRGSMLIPAALIAAAFAAAVAVSPAAAQPRGPAVPVPSHQPKLTHALWEKLVHRQRTHRVAAASAGCRPVRAVFYTEDDWLRLATKLAANASPCAQYYISIPPLAADKTNFRSAQPAQIRALGPQFHVLAEISYNGWSSWVAQTGKTFYDAGVEARRRMAAQGFDVAAGDSWIVNELSSAVRTGAGSARQKIRDLVRGLYEGDGAVPRVRGGIYDIGVGQSTSDLTTYKLNLQSWYGDDAFWQDMGSYVSDWEQEVYGDVRDYAVAGAAPDARAAWLDAYLQHPLSLAGVAPPEAATAASYLQQAYSPLGNAAWAYDSGFGYTDVPVAQMEDYISAQVYAMRAFDASRGSTDRFGFAWAPQLPDGSPWTQQFTADSGALLQRLATAIHDSDSAPAAACGSSWCTASLPGAAFAEGWQTFSSWSYPTLAFSAPVSVSAGSAGQLSVGLTQAGVAQTAATPLTVTFSSSSPTAGFAASADGPWASTLDVQVPAGGSTAAVFFRDTTPGSPAVAATAPGWQPATQAETVTAAPVVAPPPGGGGGGGGVRPDLAVALAASAATVPAAGGELDVTATVSTLNAGSASDAQLVLDVPSGYAVSRVYADRGSCAVAEQRITCDAAWISPGTATHVTVFGTVAQPVPLTFGATVTSMLEPELDPSNNAAAVTLLPAQPVVEGTSGGGAALRALRAPRIVGSARVGRTLHVLAARWSRVPAHVTYRWQLCRGARCTVLARGTTLHVKRSYAGRSVRVVATAENVTSASARVLVRR